MSKTLREIAEELHNKNKKVQLIYAFNGTGKTQLSKEFTRLINEEEQGEEVEENNANIYKLLYYNAFSEDLFYWQNEEENNILKIHPNDFIDWIVRDRGQDQNIISNFQRYTTNKITPSFIEHTRIIQVEGKFFNQSYYPEVTFTINNGDEIIPNAKISKAEEGCFIWSVFYSFFKEIIDILKYTNGSYDEDTFNKLEYIFIDDPVSSLDDNHLIELAVDVATLIKSCEKTNLNFILTTHNPLFYNVLSNEFNNKYPNKNSNILNDKGVQKQWLYKEEDCIRYRLVKNNDGTYKLSPLGRSTPFSYHLSILSELQNIKETDHVKKFHFSFIRNILEKTATFLGHSSWEELLPKMPDGSRDQFANRILNLSSHSAHAGEEIAEIQENDKTKFIELVNYLETEYKFSKRNITDATL